MYFRLKFYTLFTLILVTAAYSQDNEELNNYYRTGITNITDSAVQYYSAYRDTLLHNLDSSYSDMTNDYYAYFRDSLYSDVRGSITETGRRSLRDMAVVLFSQFSRYHKSELDTLNDEFTGFFRYLTDVVKNNLQCKGCITRNDYNAGLSGYRDLIDSLGDDFQEKVSGLADDIDSLSYDSLMACEDSLAGFTDYIVEKAPAKKKVELKKKVEYEENESEFDIDLTYINHESYRGRDNGIHENSYSPSLSFVHSSGFGITAGLKWLRHAKYPLDEIEIGVSYSHRIYRQLSGSLSFTRFWFRDSTSLSRSVLGYNAEGGLYINTQHFNSGVVFDIDFGGGNSELSATLSGSLPVTLSERFLGGVLTTEPGISVVAGQQNSLLVSLRRIRRMLLGLGMSKKSVFTVMSYEFNLPLELDYEHLEINPSMSYVVPVNVIDASTNHGFFSFMIDLTVPFRF